ncbi:Flagellar biosynthetic protein FliQ [Saliniradius amylolyticus]|uniref:Flagellar biosynthetic protein FliQ n=1 Tax=Saliniradius amylolyticus TaxID=2183582 RepID=A0A2S2E4V4_9ALTE|nr:flagellar biosynthesis protein FliQ [Saliniradius amylolyticus]AWL12552.1 Flagellar biosynthetic protein FliQ [Saliniradius amylolyticus]
MSPELFVEILRDALEMVIIMVTAIILPSLIVGLIVSVFQAATSINEQTINFLPRLLVTMLAIMLGGHWMTDRMTSFFIDMVQRIPEVVG